MTMFLEDVATAKEKLSSPNPSLILNTMEIPTLTLGSLLLTTGMAAIWEERLKNS